MDVVVDASMDLLETSVPAALAELPDLKEVEAEYPGLAMAMWTEAKPELHAMLVATLPDLWKQLAEVFANRLTAQEIEEARAFYSAPLGKRIIASLNRNFDFQPVLNEFVRYPEAKISEETLAQGQFAAIRKTVPEALESLTAEEEAAAAQFAVSGAARNLLAIGAEMRRLTAEWSNAEEPAWTGRIEAAMTKGAEKFIAAEEAKQTRQ